MKSRCFFYVPLFIIFILGCGPKSVSVIDQWREDDSGCWGNRTWDNLELILKKLKKTDIDSVQLLNILGKPQEVFVSDDDKTIIKFEVSERCFKGLLDTCFGVVELDTKAKKIIEYYKICQ